jgi:hypothetical protein
VWGGQEVRRCDGRVINNGMAQPVSNSRPARRPFWFRPRFSLAAALLTITLCAVGLWYWYRVPFELSTDFATARREVETVRRTWDGFVRHGSRRIYEHDRLLLVENYADGRPHGKWEWLDAAGKPYLSAEFSRGKLISFVASPQCDQRLARHLAEGRIKNDELVMTLMKPINLQLDGSSLFVAGKELRRSLKVPLIYHRLQGEVVLDPTPPELGQPGEPVWRGHALSITWNEKDAPLIVALGGMLQPHDLVCDYRYGMLWIADRQEAETWRDPTGIDQIVPPAGTRLAKNWEANSGAEFIETPLRAAVEIAVRQHVPLAEFDWSHVSPERQDGRLQVGVITLNLEHIPMKHVLGVILEQSGCRARLDGETLVIEPPPAGSAANP